MEFEYPQKLEKINIKADILKMVEEEEIKLKTLADEKAMDELRKTYLTYEEYYDYDVRKETAMIVGG